MAKAKNRNRAVCSIEELRHASLAVQYEMVTLGTTHQMLQELAAHWGSPSRDQALSNALLHSFLLAARSLLAFLYSHDPRPSDVIAEDFFDDPAVWASRRLIPEPEMANGELLDLISKRLVHLTWDRVDSTKPLWGAFRIVWNIGLVMQSFLQLVAKKKVHPQLGEDVTLIVDTLKAHLAHWGGPGAIMAPVKELVEFDDVGYFAKFRMRRA
jgi:hypothetical protein